MADEVGIDGAANAFLADMDDGAPKKQSPVNHEVNKHQPTGEALFGGMGEYTENSEAVAGGDDLEDPKPKRTAKPKAEKEEPEEEEEEQEEEDDEDSEVEYELDEEGNVKVDENGEPVVKEKPEEEEEDDDVPEDDLNKTYKVSVDGQDTEVTLKEALSGYIRQQTFHTRLNKVAEAANVVRDEGEKIVAERDRLVNEFKILEDTAKALVPAEPDWDTLYAEDPVKARMIEKNYRSLVAKVEEIKGQTKKAAEDAAEAQKDKTVSFAQSEFPKFAKRANWKDQAHMQRDLRSMRKTALAQGFSPEEVAVVYDSRMLGILLKASKYDRMIAARPKAVKQTGKTITAPGAGKPRTAPKGMDRAQRNLRRTGGIEAAAQVFQKVISPN